MNNIAVIGGGASGILAAISASMHGAVPILIEKNQRIGKKILMTGNGRCNFTNINAEDRDYNLEFVKETLADFSPSDTMDFFKKLGMLYAIEDDGRAYPMSGQAGAVLDVLRMELKRRKVEVITDFEVDKIIKKGNHFEIKGKNGRKIDAQKVIIATGGKAAPKTGSDGTGYRLLRELGHTVITPEPALVQLKTDKGIQGVRATAKVTLNGMTEFGEVQFTNYGLSGIPVLNLSRYAKEGDTVSMDLVPDIDENMLYEYLQARPEQELETYLVGIVNKPLGQMILKELNIGKLSKNSKELTENEKMKIVKALKNRKFTVKGKMNWDNAQVTMGGADTMEFCKKTMESKKIKGLYATGEVLNIDGKCGGYNLQWAWSSGFVAGKSAAQKQEG